jgi:hypothetical protein
LDISTRSYFERLFLEAIKWVASLLLCVCYIVRFQSYKGTVLLLFRWNVSKGLLMKNQKI